jgi:PTH1 family peptidyl-tRNA hydrolase
VGVDRPPGSMDPVDYLLQPFARDEESRLREIVARAVAAVECWLADGILAAMDQFNRPGQDAEGADLFLDSGCGEKPR